MPRTVKTQTKEETKTVKTRKTASSTTEKKPRATRAKKVEEEAEPVFKTIKEELAWLNKKKSLTDVQKARLDYLKKPVIAITDKSGLKPVKKTKKAKKKAKPAVLLENGEYVATPTTYTKLKSYITTYCKAVGWKDKKFKFADCPFLGLKDFKITGDKDKKEVYVTGKLIFQSPSQLLSKSFSKTFTLENHKKIIDLIKNTFRNVKSNWQGVKEVNKSEFSKNGWCVVY